MNIKTIEIKNSSAISKVSFWYDSNLIAITYTKSKDQDKEYLYACDDVLNVETQIIEAEKAEESVGKLFHKLVKDGILTKIENEEFN
jgi:hypothetical protein